METSAYCDNCGPFKYSRLGLSMNIWWGAAPSNWKLFGFILILNICNPCLTYVCISNMQSRHTQAIKKFSFWKHFLSSLAVQMMFTWQNLTVSFFHCTATDNNKSRESEITLKMITLLGKTHTDVYVGLATAKLKKSYLKNLVFLYVLCIKISHNLLTIRMCKTAQQPISG